MRARFLVLLLPLVCLALPSALHAQRELLPPDDLAIVQQKWPNAIRTSTGLRYVVLDPGKGAQPQPGDLVAVLYTGSLINGKVFDANQDRGHPFTFRVGRGEVIPGWDEALQHMRPGGKIIAIIPSDLGYGMPGKPPRIPNSATLIFEIELVSVTPEN